MSKEIYRRQATTGSLKVESQGQTPHIGNEAQSLYLSERKKKGQLVQSQPLSTQDLHLP